jgi:hypothetical protein
MGDPDTCGFSQLILHDVIEVEKAAEFFLK